MLELAQEADSPRSFLRIPDWYPSRTSLYKYYLHKSIKEVTVRASQHHQPNFPNHNPNHQQQRQPYTRSNGPQGNSKEFRCNDLLRRQHDLADEMDGLLAWEQALCAQFQQLADLESRLHGQKGVAALSILLSGGRSVVEQNYFYERSRLAQERLHLQQQ
jgi:hypothetical protein